MLSSVGSCPQADLAASLVAAHRNTYRGSAAVTLGGPSLVLPCAALLLFPKVSVHGIDLTWQPGLVGHLINAQR